MYCIIILIMICYIADDGIFILSLFSQFCYNADSNGDGYFDEQELEALFTKEVKASKYMLCFSRWTSHLL